MAFIKPENIVAQAGLKAGDQVTDFGCGAGFYSVAASQIVGNAGHVTAIDVQESKLVATKSAAAQKGFLNLSVYQADLEKHFDQIQTASQDLVILASILHEVKNREGLIKNAYAVLKTGGAMLVVDWQVKPSPFGPAMEKRIDQQAIIGLLETIGLKLVKEIPADNYHYALLFKK
ncbi:MAG: methyltransferase domain-containing protein [Candidatus Doudnabacteria bacterium]